MAGHTPPSDATITGIRRAAGTMATSATQRVEQRHAWFSQLSPRDRSWIGVIAQGGIMSFLDWLEDPHLDEAGAVDVFADAPRELTRSITLEHTLDLIRTVIEVVEEEAPAHAAPGEESTTREAVLHYSREVAFAAAHVYARAAESRGAWDARLESLVVDAVVRGESDDSLGSRVSALGWGDVRGVCVVVGTAPRGGEQSIVDPLRRAARHAGWELLVSVEGRRLIAVVGGLDVPDHSTDAAGRPSTGSETISRHDDGQTPAALVAPLAEHFGDGPVVCGPLVPHLYAAGRSARDAIRGFDAAPAAHSLPRPCASESLLPERAISGDDRARRLLASRVRPLLDTISPLGGTARAYLASSSLEATGRVLFVHTNTVRYRLGRIAHLTGYDLTDADDAFALRLGLMLADLDASSAVQPRRLEGSL